MLEDAKHVINIWGVGGIIFWLFGLGLIEYTIGFTLFVAAIVGIFKFLEWSDDKKKQENEDRERALLNNMTENQRKIYFQQKKENLNVTFKENEIIAQKSQQESLAKAEARAERELRLAEKQAATVKLPLGAKIAASGYIGYKVGKKIAKW